MATNVSAGDHVQTPLGKAIVREVRSNGNVVVDINGRIVILEGEAVKPLEPGKPARRKKKSAGSTPDSDDSERRGGHAEVDLHGLTVEEALGRAEQALNDALLADVSELRLIHGKSGGRIRSSLHRWLKEIDTVRAFRLDPRNEGVTIVSL